MPYVLVKIQLKFQHIECRHLEGTQFHVLSILMMLLCCLLGPQEPEEKFTLQLFQVTGGAALDQPFANVIIAVLKKGYPSGLFRLSGTVRPSTVITEPQSGTQPIDIPVQREFGSTGSVLVSIFIFLIKPSSCFLLLLAHLL